MQRTIDGKNYYAFEYKLTSPNYSSHSFATIAIANGNHPSSISRVSINCLPLSVAGELRISIWNNLVLNMWFDSGRYYTLVVGALDRRWKKLRNKLKLVADSFRVLDIWNYILSSSTFLKERLYLFNPNEQQNFYHFL